MNNEIWNQLLAITEQLNNVELSKEDSINLIVSRLQSIDIAYERSFDPADNFEEYVAVALCQAIKNTLED